MNVLIMYHCRTNTGYAIASLELVFHEAMTRVFGREAIHYAYASLDGGMPSHAVLEPGRIFAIEYQGSSKAKNDAFFHWLRERNIQFVLGFDLGLRAPILRTLRRAGVSTIASYWGASISGIYPWYLLPLRRLQYLLSRGRPDHFIFESEGMRLRATAGSAIPAARTSVCYLGVDTARFRPQPDDSSYAYTEFGIPRDRRIIMFSGHMEQRKGVHILIEAFSRLLGGGSQCDLQLLLLGNNEADRDRLLRVVTDDYVRERITFGGYRTDISRIHHSVSIAAIASCGWDSFTMSSIEFASSGIPLVVSDLPGLRETVEDNITGMIVAAGDIEHLRMALQSLLEDSERLGRMQVAARLRAERVFSMELQVTRLASLFSDLARAKS